ncbi:uncharacterized protein LOC124807274 [Hydra vulgaris]|uniref:uncharacterized protein LOC124807274 n=1 Tax=Hydra vulgaris TaxID=6087 RepID=UPI001F5FAF52|nr:uncharacterized protein LOC124807274 [Hydra vulgaris]
MEQSQTECNNFDYLKVKKLPRDVFKTFADELPKHWKKLARFLNIRDEEINRVKNEFDTTREQIYEIFISWCRNNPDKTWSEIKSGLIFCERKDVIDKCQRMLNIRSIFGVQHSSEKLFLRQKELCKIHQYLIGQQDKKNSTLVLLGMSGVGKTEIARKYCEVYHNFYENFVWIDAAFGKLQTSMNNLYELLGFIVQDSQGNSFNIEVIVKKIHNYYKNEKTLYILDNVDDESVRSLEMYISSEPNSFTLVTTQWKTWSNNVNQMFIDVFTAEDAFAYVEKNIKENNKENIRNLIKELSYHPFAITQAIKYINIHKISLEKYIDRYRSKPLEILDNDNFPTEEESKSAIKAINLVLTKLEKTKTIPFKIINCLSYCNGQNISKQFIIQISKHMAINEECFIDEAIGLLINYSLLDCLNHEKYSMHELTQLSCKNYQNKSTCTNTYLNLIESYFKFELNQVKEHVDHGNYFVFHFLYMFHTNKKRMLKTIHHITTPIKNLLVCKGLFQEAIEILKAVQIFNAETHGENNKLTLDAKQNIAICLNNMGKYNEALEIYYSVEKIQTEILGINHLSTIATKNNIANCLSEMEKYNDALEIYYSVDKIQIEILGINHQSTMETKNNIAICLREMGKYNEALEIYYSVDKIQTEILGITHSSTMATKNNIANCLNEIRKYNEALEIYYFVDKIQTKILGINHPSTMKTKNNIAICLSEMEKYDEALEVFDSFDKIQTEVLGINHPSTMETKNNIALCFYNKGKYNEALEIYKFVDNTKTEILGITHPSTMTTKNNMANCLYKMEKYNEALKIYYSVDKKQTKILGIKHPSTIGTRNNIASCLLKMEKYSEALENYYSIDKIQTEDLGIKHPSTIATRNNIASCLYKMKKYSEALEKYYSVDKIQTEILDIKHSSTIATKNNIANCLYKMGKYNKALETYYSVDKIQTQVSYIDQLSVTTTKNNIANCLYKMGKYIKALEIYYSVDKMQTEIFGINHSSTIVTKNNIASCLNEMQKYNEALKMYNFVDKIQSEVLGFDHPDTVRTKSKIATCLSNLEKRRKCCLTI